MKTSPPKTIHVMFWYHDNDAIFQKALEGHLWPSRDCINTWDHGNLPPGADWQQEFRDALAKADMILPLVSVDFFQKFDDECIRQAVERHRRGEVDVVPIILRPFNWQKTSLRALDVFPSGGQSVITASNLDEILSNIADTLDTRARHRLRKKQRIHWTSEGDAFFYDGEYEKALQSYEEALRQSDLSQRQNGSPSTTSIDEVRDVLRKKAKILCFLKQYKKAWNVYEIYLLDVNADITDYLNLAEICFHTGHYSNARSAYESALRLEPKNADLHYRLAHFLLYHLGDLKSAINYYTQAIQYDPSHVQWYIEKGHALRRLQRPKEALEAYEAAIQIDAGSALAFTNKGVALCELKSYEPALQAYQRAVFLDPTNAMAYWGMAFALGSMGKGREAHEALMQAEQLGYSRNLAFIPPPPKPGEEGSPQPQRYKSSSQRLCTHGHSNPVGSVWCEQCEEYLSNRVPLADSFVL